MGYGKMNRNVNPYAVLRYEQMTIEEQAKGWMWCVKSKESKRVILYQRQVIRLIEINR